MDNYIVINGKKAELTEEQLEKLGIEAEKKRNNPFNTEPQRISVCSIGTVCVEYRGTVINPLNLSTAELLVERANSFNDWEFANQVYLHELLNRKLLKYAYDNEYEDNQEWDGVKLHWFVVYDDVKRKFDTTFSVYYKPNGLIYFSSEGAAQKAIEEVVKPFIEEHKDFKW